MNRMLFLVGRLILWRAPDVEARTAPCRGAQWLTLPERSDRYRMGDRGTHDSARAPRWAQTIGQCARGAERDFLHPMDRVSVEGVAQRPAAKEHGARLSGTVELGRHVGAHPPYALRGGARAGGM